MYAYDVVTFGSLMAHTEAEILRAAHAFRNAGKVRRFEVDFRQRSIRIFQEEERPRATEEDYDPAPEDLDSADEEDARTRGG